MDSLERIARALESIDDFYRHVCRPCEGTGAVVISYDRRNSLGLERDFSGVTGIIPDTLGEKLGTDEVLVRVACVHCDGTGRLVPREAPSASVWGG